ncbi:MAG: hypothetical protein WCY23_05895 [Candidatus Omnitrophota bacterium]
MRDKQTLIKAIILGAIGFWIAFKGYGVIFYYGWIFILLLLIVSSIPPKIENLIKNITINFVIIAVLSLSLTATGQGIRMFQKWQVCNKLNPVIAELEKYKKAKGEYPLSLDSISKPGNLKILAIREPEEDNSASLFALNENDAIIYLSKNTCGACVPVTKVLIFSFTRFYAYTYSSADSAWKLERVIWTWVGASRKVL